MKIGEFARACGISISALRYYDEQGLISPVYTDSFTGYRYYSSGQIEVCNKIGMLKAAGFSLTEIKALLGANNKKEICDIFAAKKRALEQTLQNLAVTEKNILEADIMKQNDSIKPTRENVNLPFENDEDVVGRWVIIDDDKKHTNFGGKNREIYFLPGGEWYW